MLSKRVFKDDGNGIIGGIIGGINEKSPDDGNGIIGGIIGGINEKSPESITFRTFAGCPVGLEPTTFRTTI